MATLRQLEAFIATAEFKKMSEAAKHLYISQPTISQIISCLLYTSMRPMKAAISAGMTSQKKFSVRQ